MPAAVALSQGVAAPAVLIIPAIFGVGPDNRARVQELAASGHSAACVDPFWRVEPGVYPYTDVTGALIRARRVDPQQLLQDLVDAVDSLRSEASCNGRVAVVGICFGGRAAWKLGTSGVADAVIAWHGGGLGGELSRIPECPIDLHFGASDTMIPAEEIAAIQDALALHPHADVHVHADANHGFTHRDAPPRYQATANSAAETGLARVLGLLSA